MDTHIWGNSLITRKNRPIFDPVLLESGINKIVDIYDLEKKEFFSYERIKQQYTIKFDNLYYLGIIAAIPRMWKVLLRSYDYKEPYDLETNLTKLIGTAGISKHIYWSLVERSQQFTWASKKVLETSLQTTISEDDWIRLFPMFLKHVKQVKLRYFQYRVLTGTLTTNVRRAKWSSGDITSKCTFCNESEETVYHLLVSCPKVTVLWTALSKICQYFLNVKVIFTADYIILNNYQGMSVEIINQMIIVMKQYIYSQKCLKQDVTFSGFMSKLSWWYSVEKCIIWESYTDKKYKKFEKKWSKLF